MVIQIQNPAQLAAPSIRLPAIGSIPRQSILELSACISYLRKIYNPHVRGSSRIREPVLDESSVKLTSNISLSDDVEAADELRGDAYERAYSLRWLSALVAYLSCLENVPESTLDDATSLIALCAGPASAGILTRNFSFPATHLDLPPTIDVRLTDIPLDNHDFHSVGAQTWGGACVLAEAIAEDPQSFGFVQSRRALRVLELGAGTGLVGIATGKVVQALGMLDARIVATDFYESVLHNLVANVRWNFPQNNDTGVVFDCHRLDWQAFPREHAPAPPLDEPFDVILGADIVYEAAHATWIKGCLERLLSRKSSKLISTSSHIALSPTFHLVIPLRPTFDSESSTIETVFPTASEASSVPQLVIEGKDIIVCDAGSGVKGEVVRYAYYRIGWNFVQDL
ncbi:putative methyltransferase-domain-containing protein [Schizophyllum amplum]|uniref:Putative methyltransferase-domain-containing protein n=1 Tax=Schizophyllum amplum TaxID=97359 RepID=A0A550C4Q1_9AGAR|nr:putative methyltransferase-domain-containing protein [Auriculariopsis ampla]